MNLNNKEIKTRHCPYCGVLLNRIETEIDSIEYGHIAHAPLIKDYDALSICFEEMEYKENGNRKFYCQNCHGIITNEFSRAKEFIQLPDKED